MEETIPLYIGHSQNTQSRPAQTASSKPDILIANWEMWGKTKGHSELPTSSVLIAEATYSAESFGKAQY